MKQRFAIFTFSLAALLLAGGCAGTLKPALEYPAARKAEVFDDYHGTRVADPYRWLEDAESEETRAWVAAQNLLTRKFLDGELRDKIKARIRQLWDYPRYSSPRKRGSLYFYSKNDGLQDQAVIYVQEGLSGKPRVLIDPNRLSTDGTVALTGLAFSHEGSMVAYLTSSKGSDWQEIKVRKVDSGEDFPEVLQYCKFTSVAWVHDGSGFYYNRFPDPQTVAPEDRNFYSRVYLHRLGTPQSQDELVHQNPDDKERGFYPLVSDDGKYLVLHVGRGTEPKNRVYYRKVGEKGDFIKLLNEADAFYAFIGNVGTKFFFHTDLEAPRGRIIAIDTTKPERENYEQIIGQRETVIDHVAMVSGQLVVASLKDAHHVLEIFDMQGKRQKEISLPEIGSVVGISGRQNDNELFYGFMSFLRPYTVYRHDFRKKETSVFREPRLDFKAGAYETKQVFYNSRDGTRVPMFITHKKGLELNGENPVMLYGYGGFTVSLTPYFSVTRLFWLENGGVYAQANLRGGNEYGEQWHQAGVLGNKQNVFDDFIAASEWLIGNDYTSSERLAIMGGSNGGLLTAACMIQRPDLFGAVLSLVPVIDMLRYHKFSVGRYWVSDYGNAEENPEHFKFLYAYSPLHNIREGVAHPPTLITTADTDDRVVPMHGKKFAAALQAADDGNNPILLRVETKAGHGSGKPTSKRIEEYADLFTFLFKTLGLQM